MADQKLTLKASEVTVDESLYPRHKIDQINVTNIVNALEVGKTLPAIVVATKVAGEATPNLLVDGRHRLTATVRRYGDAAEVEAIGREYATTAALFEEAVALNVGRGKDVGHHDTALIVVRAEELGIPLERVADLLSVSADRLKRRPILAKPIAHSPGLGAASQVLLKKDLAHLEGHTLTAEQVSANQRAAGAVRFHAQQLSMRLESDTVNFGDPKTIKALVKVRDMLNDLTLSIDEAA